MRRLATLALAAALTSLVVGTAAFAAVGDLIPQGCIEDDDFGADACAGSTNGLNFAISVAVSPDGESVYAGSLNDDALVRFDRNASTGALTPLDCIDDPATGPETCAQTSIGLGSVDSIAVSADGESVYVASFSDDAIVRFDRDTGNGALTPQGCIDDNDTGPETCGQTTDGLKDPQEVAVSPNGKSVYASGSSDNAVVRFDRNTASGALTPAGCIEDNDVGPDGCASATDGLEGAGGVTISPDGSSVYVGTNGDDAVVHFDRGSATGALTPVGCVQDNDSGTDACTQSADGLNGVFGVTAVGNSVYGSSQQDDAVVRLGRNTATGELTPAGCIDDNDTGADACSTSTDGLNGPFGAPALSADGSSLYVASFEEDAIVRFARTNATGALAPIGCVQDNDTGSDACSASSDGLDAAARIVTTADGRSAYAVAGGDSAVTRFDLEIDTDGDGVPDASDGCPAQAGPASNNGCPPSDGGGGGGGGGDTAAPNTTITAGPKSKEKKGNASFEFSSSEAGSTFQCKLDDGAFEACTSPEDLKVKKGKHTFEVRATDAAGNTDPTPATQDWTVKKKKKK